MNKEQAESILRLANTTGRSFTRVYDEGLQMGEYDAQSGHPYNEDPASGYPEGTPLHQSYQCGYRHGWQ